MKTDVYPKNLQKKHYKEFGDGDCVSEVDIPGSEYD